MLHDMGMKSVLCVANLPRRSVRSLLVGVPWKIR